jgi:hypothetical protein
MALGSARRGPDDCACRPTFLAKVSGGRGAICVSDRLRDLVRTPTFLNVPGEHGRAGNARADARRRARRDPRGRPPDLRAISGRILAEARSGDGLPDRVRLRPGRGRVPRCVDPGGVWRCGSQPVRCSRDSRGDSAVWLQRRRLPCADVRDGDAPAATAVRRRRPPICR